jgi:hypothetical protein
MRCRRRHHEACHCEEGQGSRGGPWKTSDAASRNDPSASHVPATRRLTCEGDIDQSPLSHRIEPKCESSCEAMLPLRLERVKLGSVNVSQQPLETHIPEQPPAAHALERLFDRQP